MKKKLALVTFRNEMKKMYFEELKGIFLDYLDIIPYSIEVDHAYVDDVDYLRTADIALLSSVSSYKFIKSLIKDDCKIIYLECAFLKNKIEALKNFPPNTKALVCFNYFEISNQAAEIIYKMGITNLSLSIYNHESSCIDADYDIAVVGENSAIVPEKISTIVSLGRRKISLSTLMDISIAADILDSKLDYTIMKYSEELAIPGLFKVDVSSENLYSKTKIQTVMDYIDDAIIILNNNSEITNYNAALINMFNISGPILNKKIADIIEFNAISKYVSINEDVENLLIEIKRYKSIMLTKKEIRNFYTYGSQIILLKDVTDIINLERTLKKQLNKKGHIAKHSFADIYGSSKEIKECINKASIIANLDKAVLIIGESGTGKELFAQSIHNASPRKNFPFVGINCAALPSNLLESELFGYEPGTFTGGKKDGKTGLFEVANNGTLFMDEIGDMSLETQAKLLRVLEEKEFMRVGGNEIISVNVRVIAATNRNLKALIDEKKFRLDLYYRLNTMMFSIPPLRKRKGDIKELIKIFLTDNKRSIDSLNTKVYEYLVDYQWEGNARELRNCIEYMANITNGEINMSHLPDYMLEETDYMTVPEQKDIFYIFSKYEKEIIINLMEDISQTGGGRRSIYNRLKLEYNSLSEYKLRKYIEFLDDNSFIEKGRGSSGLRLTIEGKKFLSGEN